ncbi:hypothetical protein K1T73_01360 [Roseovarius sp. SCSIO 43702]|uniref:hypothetical protein n=1 Tax=Roseovarius sp. SCSIO 43702 TaxID=2823043 RepID=UPI001C731055|nr:hypothetical protein [Roseovarius sp. SCSIO 43702]QYX57091.1 hypothetical protein K1T73_01360 [Roseovarius sp. SCSIO 43702]
MKRDVRDLVEVTRVAFERERGQLAAFLETETALRRDIARLDAHRAEMMRLPVAELRDLRAIGAEIAWTAWQDRRRRELTHRLARHLAGKEAVMARVRLAFGRHEAAASLMKQEVASQRRRAAGAAGRARDAQMILTAKSPA